MLYETREIEPRAARSAIVELWRSNRSIPGDLTKIYDWYYFGSPSAPGTCFVLEQRGAQQERSIVGATGVGERRMRYGDTELRVGLLGDFFVDKAHRSLFPALQLQRTARDRASQRLALLYGFPNAKASSVFRRLGFEALGEMQRWVRVIRYDRYVEQRLRERVGDRAPALAVRAFGSAGATLLNVASTLYRLPAAARHLRAYSCAWLSDFDTRFDELFASSALHDGLLGVRDQRFLRWRFLHNPSARPQLFTLSRRRSERLSGYAVTERDGTILHVRDAFARNHLELGHVLAALELQARRAGAHTISFQFFGPRRVTSVLSALGYVPRPPGRTIFGNPGTHAGARFALPRSSDAWYITDADEDQ